MFKKILGALMILIGVAGGIVADLIFFVVGGVEQIVRGFEATPINGGDVAWGFVRVFPLNGVSLFVGIVLLVIPGIALVTSKPKTKRKARTVYTPPNHRNASR